MDFNEKYRAVSARDQRFDGMFVVGIQTTGIYCRPSCPARTPKPANVEFFVTAAAAHHHGYRACKRCLPDSTPQNPLWKRRDDLPSRAMRLIQEGYVDQHGVSGLASRLGFSERHLQRMMLDELGATPLELAQAHRAQNARHLLTQTNMAVSEVAFASGFRSVRQFNDVIRSIFDLTPSELRHASKSVAHTDGSTGTLLTAATTQTIQVQLVARQPFNGEDLIAWFGRRAISGLECALNGCYVRTIRFGDDASPRAVVIEVRPSTTGVHVAITLEDMSDLAVVLTIIRRLFDLDADAHGVESVLRTSPMLTTLVDDQPGLRVPGSVDLTEVAVRAILGQQVTVEQARQNVERLVTNLGDQLPREFTGDDQLVTHIFPTPQQIAEAPDELFKGPRQRRENLRALCTKLAAGELQLDIGTTLEELREQLISQRGIGPWTADYMAMRFLGHPDVYVRGDAGVIGGARLLGVGNTAREIETWANQFAPWRSYLTMYLWSANSPPTTVQPATAQPAAKPPSVAATAITPQGDEHVDY